AVGRPEDDDPHRTGQRVAREGEARRHPARADRPDTAAPVGASRYAGVSVGKDREFGDSMLLFTAREIRLRGVFPAFPGLRDARRTRAPATMPSPRPQPHTSSRVRMA